MSPVRCLSFPLRTVLVAVTALALSAVGAAAVSAPATAGAAIPAGRYHAVAPTRVLDTRTTNTPWHDGESRVVDLSSVVSVGASAVVINLTVTDPSSAGFLTAFPAGASVPNASSLNFTAGQVRANSVTVGVGTGSLANKIAVYALVNNIGTADVVIDVTGYYGAGGTNSGGAGSSYSPLGAPVRMFDTRSSIGPLTNQAPKNVGIVTIDYGSPAVNKSISAVLMNITVTEPTGPGFLTVWNGLGAPPNASTVNFAPGQTVANMTIAPVHCTDAACSSVTFSIKNNISASTQVVGDIAGAYMTPAAGGLVYTPRTPSRVTDTRLSTPFGRLGPSGTGTTTLTGLPTGVRAVNLNFTAVLPTGPTYLAVYPAGVGRPDVSNINVVGGDIAANAAQVTLSRTSQFVSFNLAGSTDVVIDLQGWFTPDPSF